MARKRLGYAARIIAFVLIAAFLWRTIEHILHKPVANAWYGGGAVGAYENPDYYDVVFSGTSVAIANMSVEEMYLEKGIAAITLGEAQQPTYLSYYSIKETLDYQKPKAVIFDTKSLFYSQESVRDPQSVRPPLRDNGAVPHMTIDYMKNGRNKYEAVMAAKELNEDVDVWSFFSLMYNNHANWENLREQYFTKEYSGNRILGNRLNIIISGKQREYSIDSVANDGAKEVIPECNKRYLLKMIELCREKGVDLILTTGYGIYNWNWRVHNAIAEIANEYGLDYLDINLLEDEVGIDWSLDISDGVHLNVSGSKKWTDYLGDYVKQKHEIPDRRLDSRYDGYKQYEEQYTKTLRVMEANKCLASATKLRQFLQVLQEMDKEGFTIFMAVDDDASNSLSKKTEKALMNLGLTKSLMNKYRYSYLAVIDDGQVIAEKISKANVSFEGTLDNGVKYKLQSGGLLSESDAGIWLDNSQKLQNKRGLHIVVYSKEIDEVLCSVRFDTYEKGNPPKS